jgi:tRNA-modifying protein YgfZ
VNHLPHHYYTDLEQEALLHLSGADALSFLQGQVTCDTRMLSPQNSLPGAYCTAQGRMVGDFLLSQLAPDHIVLRMRREIRASNAAVLSKYIVFSRAALEAEREDWQLLACWGADSARALGEIFGPLPQVRYGARSEEHFLLVQLDDAGQQFECYIDRAAGGGLLNQLQSALQPAPESTWQALQIASGIGRIQARTSGEFIPQMLNYDLTGHVSFNKGCYTGQEIVARMHYRGKPKRRLYLASLPGDVVSGDEPIVAGTGVFSADDGKSVGVVVNAARADDGHLAVLASATAGGAAAGLHPGSPQGPLLTLQELPYPVPD